VLELYNQGPAAGTPLDVDRILRSARQLTTLIACDGASILGFVRLRTNKNRIVEHGGQAEVVGAPVRAAFELLESPDLSSLPGAIWQYRCQHRYRGPNCLLSLRRH
jgi:hypothetical protein